MNPRRRKALEGVVEMFNKHLGHTVKTREREGVLVEVKLFEANDGAVMIRLKGEPFPTLYCDEVKSCSCGEGSSNASA